MHSVTFVHGPYDDAIFSFCDRLPDGINLVVECVNGNPLNSELRDLLHSNLSGDVNGIMIVPNTKSVAASYSLASDADGCPYYQHTGWSLNGATVKTS
jgi:hypothetical protein